MNAPFLTSLRSRLLIVLLGLTLLPVLLVGGLAYRNARKTVESRVIAHLTLVADLKVEQITTWLDDRHDDVRLLADNFLNEEHFTEILDPQTDPERRDAFAAFLTDNLLSVQQARRQYSEILFVDSTAKVILSTDPANVGTSMAWHPAVTLTLNAPTGEHVEDIHRASDSGQIEMAFGHVLHAVDLATEEVLPEVNGAVIVRVRMDETIYPLLHAWPGKGATGETLLVRADGDDILFISPLRFKQDAALDFRLPSDSPDARPAFLSSRGAEGVIETTDYRGVPVLAAYRHIPQTGWGFVARQDRAEAFAPVADLARGWILITALILLAAVVVAVLLARGLIRPLARLVAATQSVAAGEFETDLDLRREDEIGALADAFRAMVAAVRVRNADLRAHAEEVSALLDLSQRFVGLLDPDRVLETALNDSQQMIPADFSAILLLDTSRNGEHLTARATRGWPSALVEELTFESGRETAAGYAVAEQTPIHVEDIEVETRFSVPPVVRRLDVRSALAVPMLAGGRPVGAFWLLSRSRRVWDDEMIQVVSLIANQTAVALERARLFHSLSESYDRTLDALVAALDARDKETEGHSQRVVAYTLALARRMDLPEGELATIRRGALLHDIGKIGVPDAVLHKPGPLSEEEWVVMRSHPAWGKRILAGIRFLENPAEIVCSHHERWDGRGYPQGLAGEVIPLGARIFAVADTFDAITSDRPYRAGQPYAVARAEIEAGGGSQFDPRVVEAFLQIPEDQWARLRTERQPAPCGPGLLSPEIETPAALSSELGAPPA